MMHDQPTRAPLREPRKILEVGCGTGIMTQHLLEKYGSAERAVGVDLSAVPQSDSARATFLQGDFFDLAERHPLLREGGFDYVFSRLLVYGITDWPGYIARAKELLAPGGWMEVQEVGLRFFDEDKELLPYNEFEWTKRQTAAWAARGLDIRCEARLADWMRAAGFVDVHAVEFRWVMGRWKGHPETDLMGDYCVKTLSQLQEDTYRKVLAPSRTAEELEEDVKGLRDTFRWSENGKHVPFRVVYGRKPGAD